MIAKLFEHCLLSKLSGIVMHDYLQLDFTKNYDLLQQLKLFEHCLLSKLSGRAMHDYLQLGFIKNYDRYNAVYIAKPVIEYFTKYGRNV